MKFSERFTSGAGATGAFGAGTFSGGDFGAGTFSGGTSWAEDTDWTKVPFSGAYEGQMWEGTEELAPAGPWGIVELPPTRALESLADAVDTLDRLNELQCWADAQKARLVDRIRKLYEQKNRVSSIPPAAEGAPLTQEQTDQDEMVVTLTAEEIGALLRLPSRAAKSLVEQSRLLVHHRKRTLASMESGKLSWRHATTVVDECIGVPADAVVQFEKDLVETAEQSTVAKLTRQARGLRELLHPQAAPIRKVRATAERRVVLEPDTDGMAWLSAYLPAEQACGIYNRLDAVARGLQAPDEPRTVTQLRADVFTDLLTHTCTGNIDTGTGYRGINATVHLTVPALTLLSSMPGGSDEGADAASATAAGTGAAYKGTDSGAGNRDQHAVLEGYGPIDPDTAARLAGHAPSFTRILTHPETGAALSIGRTVYRPPKHLRDWVRVRDKTCRHPGCNRAAMATEIDHTTPWHKGGSTNHNNLCCLCKRHHMLKTTEHWNYLQPEPGTIIATSPAGRTYVSRPPPF